MLERLTEYDINLLVYLNNLGSESQDSFWLLITHIWFWIPLYIFLIYLMIRKYSKKECLRLLYTFIAVLVANFGLTYYVKENVLRSRPVNNEKIFHSLRVMIQPLDYSFFSGHACSSFAIATFFYLFMRKHMKYAAVVYVWPVLFSYSRIYLAVHFPSDITVGAAVGTSLAIFFYWLHKVLTLRIDNRNQLI